MSEYTPLTSLSPEDEDYNGLDDAPQKRKQNGNHSSECKLPLWVTMLLAAIAVIAAGTFHLSLLSNRSSACLTTPSAAVAGLAMIRPSPFLDQGRHYITKKIKNYPRMKFPVYMVRASQAEPDTVFNHSSTVFLSPSDSMFYHWKINSTYDTCYVSGYVSSLDRLAVANKTFATEGDVTAIEIWNVTAPVNAKAMSWNTRPRRLNLMGTVNFTSRDAQNELRSHDGQELRPPTPRFPCKGVSDLNIEITCQSCWLQFEQIFSTPPLGFEVIELG